ncbi:MAG: hypothetical protein NE327_09250, partial [Lentisphaeraceae bacterium]|nr:hypothetical protein [Lentisphaeraceae bacterium]
HGVKIGDERIEADTVLWAAGVEASRLGRTLNTEADRQGRVVVKEDLIKWRFQNAKNFNTFKFRLHALSHSRTVCCRTG